MAMSKMMMTRKELNEILFTSLTAIYAFEREKVNRFELSYAQIYLLQLLRRRSPSRMSEIAYRMGMPLSTATRFVANMEKKNLLERVTDVSDRRAVLVSLNDKGRKAVKAVENHSFRVISTNLQDFSEEEINAFLETATCLNRILSTRPKNVEAAKADK